MAGRFGRSIIWNHKLTAAESRRGSTPKAEFVHGDLRDRDTIAAALDRIDVVFHQAAYGGYMPEITKYVHVN